MSTNFRAHLAGEPLIIVREERLYTKLLLLLALHDAEMHGYALAREITESSAGLVRLEPGNLYRVIKRLVDDGLVKPAG